MTQSAMDLDAMDLARLAWSQAWQVTLLIVAVALLVRLAGRNRPHLAHAMWLVVLAKCLTPPLWSSPSGIFCWLQGERSQAVAASDATSSSHLSFDRGDTRSQRTPNLTVRVQPSRDKLLRPTAEKCDQPLARTLRPVAAAHRPPLAVLLASIWLAGAVSIAAIAVGRCLICLRRVNHSRCQSDPALESLLQQLAQRLKLRRRVRLAVAECQVGPAVVGLFRPTILLPSAIVRGKPAVDLEPILAHELLHVRRGDLWIGALQTVAQAVWWFHPLVWLANRMASREAERCCDEEVVGELGCPPARYARSLLTVLELKQTLKPVPAFPGVRPVEVTSRRLERIMQLGQGSLKRTPWWCWASMLLLAAVTLPGAALVLTAHGEPPTPVDMLPAGTLPADKLPGTLPLAPENNELPLTPAPRNEAVDFVPPAPPRPTTTKSEWELQINTRIISGPPQDIDAVCNQWNVKPADLLDDKSTAAESSALRDATPGDKAPRGQAHYSVEKELPVLYEVMEQSRADQILERLQARERVNVIMSPKVRLLNGHWATIEDAVQRPFVVGVRDGKPQVRTVREGLLLRVRPTAKPEGTLLLDCELTLATIRGVETTKISVGHEKASLQLQVPEVATTRLRCEFDLALDQTLLVGGLKTKDGEGHDQSVLLMLQTVRPKDAPAQADRESSSDLLYGTGINSEAGITGSVNLVEPAHEAQAGERADQQARASLGTWSVRNLPRSAHLVVESSTSGGITTTACKGGVRLLIEPDEANRLSDARDRTILVEADEAFLTSPADGVGDLQPDGAHPSLSLKGNARLKFGACVATCERAVLESTPRQPSEPQTEGAPAVRPIRIQLEGNVHVRRGVGRQASVLLAERVCLGFDGDADCQIQADGLGSIQPLVLKTYPVADLVVPLAPHAVKIDAGGEQAEPSQIEPSDANFNTLIELITTTIAPQSWSEVGGGGAIDTHRPSLSLVIRQESAIHEQIADLLEQLRRLQDVQVAIQIETIQASQGAHPDLDAVAGQPMTAAEAENLREKLRQDHGVKVAELLQLTLLSGQAAEVPLPAMDHAPDANVPKLQLVPLISSNRREVRLHWAIGAKDALDAIAKCKWLDARDGQSLLVELTEPIAAASRDNELFNKLPYLNRIFQTPRNGDADRVFLLLTPRIIVAEEEELLPAKARSLAP